MTLQHILYIPTLLLLGFLLGAMVTERRRSNPVLKLQTDYQSPAFEQGTSGKILFFSFLIFIFTFIITHSFPIPYGSTMVKNALGGLEIFDKQPSFSSTEVYSRLQAYPLVGLEVYKRFTYTIDIIFPVSFFYFLITLARFVYQRTPSSVVLKKVLSVLPFIWLLFDLLENAMLFTLLSQFPTKNIFLASVLGFVTIIKFGLLFLSLLMPSIFFVFFRKSPSIIYNPLNNRISL